MFAMASKAHVKVPPEMGKIAEVVTAVEPVLVSREFGDVKVPRMEEMTRMVEAAKAPSRVVI